MTVLEGGAGEMTGSESTAGTAQPRAGSKAGEHDLQALIDANKLVIDTVQKIIESGVVTGIPVDLGGGTKPLNEIPPKLNRFLPYVLGGMMAIAVAPALYRAGMSPGKGKRKKADEETAKALDAASSRATTMIAAFAPVIALPMTYIAIDELENRQIITGHLGDDVQTLIGAMATGSLITSLASFAKAIV